MEHFRWTLAVAGAEALDIPWIRRLIETWRSIALDAARSTVDRKAARKALGYIGPELARAGSGGTPGENRRECQRLRPVLLAFFKSYQRDPTTRQPPAASEVDVTSNDLLRLESEAASTVTDDVLGSWLGIEPESVRRLAAKADR